MVRCDIACAKFTLYRGRFDGPKIIVTTHHDFGCGLECMAKSHYILITETINGVDQMTKRDLMIRLLTRAGHSPAKALQIAIDFERGSEKAQEWIVALERMESRK